MIPIYKEEEGLGEYETCIFCKKPTPFWHEETNSAVCESCANAMHEEDITIANNRIRLSLKDSLFHLLNKELCSGNKMVRLCQKDYERCGTEMEGQTVGKITNLSFRVEVNGRIAVVFNSFEGVEDVKLIKI